MSQACNLDTKSLLHGVTNGSGKQERSPYPCVTVRARSGRSLPCPSAAELTLRSVLIASNWHRDRPRNKTVVHRGQGKAKALADNERKTTASLPPPPGKEARCARSREPREKCQTQVSL